MIPSDPQREVIDPRRLVREHGRDALALLAEGERGGGKTEMVDALAYACNRPYFELQGMEGLSLKDILFEWDEQSQNKFVVQAVETGALTLEQARRQQWRGEFLNLGEIL